MALSLAISPCPNDTFVFHALVHGLVPGAPPVKVTYADVDVTNTAAERGAFDLVKVSYAALPWLLDDYHLLPCGGALGRGNGPLVLTRGDLTDSGSGDRDADEYRAGSGDRALHLDRAGSAHHADQAGSADHTSSADPDRADRASSGNQPDRAGSGDHLDRANRGLRADRGGHRGVDLSGATVAVPGDRTTAYLLFRLWAADRPPARIEVVPFHEIMPGVAAGRYDAGLVIHEARFTYPRYGLTALVDLGEWWEADTGLPIPLGAILARRGAVDPRAAAGWIRESVRRAWADPAASRDYVLAHAQEMEPDVVDRHIGLYVNEFTADLGDAGFAAVEALLGRATDAGLVPQTSSSLATAWTS
ncbi:1,4-dihydroxy-6-naphthoate synthase [Micromonospora phytophila]|uniref:1,4-dihydroxy-6-naphthoate synthase n=1 Tax=Micromonospora phytophila TaxID=709888 RepID=UPI00202F78DE|nr:1,4-dihydroxy-6-naphthoate synthase [Micromonospora phytophila]MCM0676261.1 1,4-dihydroxy-6-naphthoate synthase [Micromonospora phytophila]